MTTTTFPVSSSSTPTTPQNMLPMRNLASPTSKPPRHRLDDPANAATLVASLWQAGEDRRLKDAAIQGQIDGNPPYSPTLMKRAGRAGDANFNTLEAKALKSAALVPYYDLFAGGNRFVEIALDLDDASADASYASGIVSDEYDRLLHRWRNFEPVMSSMLSDFITFGRGYLVWSQPDSWRFAKVAHYRVLVPDATPIDLDELELFVLIQNWPVTYLMDKIRDSSAASALGWDVSATREAIMSAVPTDPAAPGDPIATQAMVRDSDIYVSARNSTVQAATLFVKEFDGTWSELIIRRDQIPSMSTTASAPAPVRFLYTRYNHYASVQECLNTFFFESADNTWNGASGLGRDIFTIMQLKDRLACTQADSVFLRNSIILQPRQEMDRQRLQLMHLGRMTVLPPGLEALQSTILGDITTTIEVSRELTMMTERNTGIYRPTLEKGGGNPDTLGEFQMKFAQATVLSTSAINRFYTQLDRLYEEQWRRVIATGMKGDFRDSAPASDWRNEARRFVSRCEARGVPRPWLRRLLYIRAHRTIGNGSAALRQQVATTFLNPQVFPLYPPDGQRNILEDFTRILGSQTAVNRYLPLSSRQDLPNNDVWAAMQENASLKIGAPVTWVPGQNNLVHAQVHLTAGAQAAASLEAGANPLDVLAYLDAIGSHTAEHLQRESAVPSSKEALRALSERWQQLASIADKLRRQAQADADQQAQNRQQLQDVVTDTDIKLAETQAKLAISREKAQGTLALKKERQDAELALKAGQDASAAAMSDASTAADITRQTAKTQADIAAQSAKAAADIENQRRKAEAQAEAARAKAAAKPSNE